MSPTPTRRSRALFSAIGQFLTIALNFLIVAAVLFLVIKAVNRLKRQEEAAPAPAAPPADVKLLTEIRDLLAARSGDANSNLESLQRQQVSLEPRMKPNTEG